MILMYNEHMSEQAEKIKIKKLPCGGHAIYGKDIKTKTEAQIGYIGANLPLDGYMPQNAEIVK